MRLKLKPVNLTKLFIVFVVVFAIFCLSGGVQLVDVFFAGGLVTSVQDAKCLYTAPFFGGFLFFGFMGFRLAYMGFRNGRLVYTGLGYMVFSYIGVEVLFYFV